MSRGSSMGADDLILLAGGGHDVEPPDTVECVAVRALSDAYLGGLAVCRR
jgi:hypothetical protein